MATAASPSSMLRRLSIIGIAISLILLTVRDFSARAPGGHFLSGVGRYWSDHPAQLRRSISLDAAEAAKAGGRISSDGKAKSKLLHRMDPLSTTPLMIAGADAQVTGDLKRAERLYALARTRNPRDPAARLLLADSLLRRGEVRAGLEEMIALARIMPHSSGPVGPALAAFAKTPGAQQSLRPVLASNPSLRAQVLSTLAQDAANARLVLRLAPSSASELGLDRPWEGIMLNALVAAGRVVEARALWHDLTGLDRRDALIINGNFANWKAPPPFNWDTSNAAGGTCRIWRKAQPFGNLLWS